MTMSDYDFKAPRVHTSQSQQLETYLGPRTTVVVDSHVKAMQMCFECLGTDRHDVVIPVIMPVSAAPQTAAAAIHAHAALVLMDVDEDTLQIDPDELEDVLDELENGAIVVFNRPGGMPISQDLLDVVHNRAPVVVDTQLVPKLPLNGADILGDFLVYQIGSGAFVLHRYSDMIASMRRWRSGLFGHSADMSSEEASQVILSLAKQSERISIENSIVLRYKQALKDKVKILFPDSPHTPHLLVEVPDADRVLAHLQSANAEVWRGITPLHTFHPIRDRFAEDDKPEYPRAEALAKRIVSLPIQPHLLENDGIEKLCEYLCEVV